jgi:hypothetical protein
MTETAAQLLAAFEALLPQEQQDLLAEMLRRSGQLPDSLLTDEQLVGLADDLFHALDAEKTGAAQTARPSLSRGSGVGK